jgi:hypothetical protein
MDAAREAIGFLVPSTPGDVVRGLTPQALWIATMALLARRQVYYEEREKKPTGQPLGSATSTSS